jgi:uncharacterized protein (TIGR01319 family)
VKDTYLVTDVGSTTTKAVLIGEKSGEYRLLGHGEYPTTVELPYEDVTIGVTKAYEDLALKTGIQITHYDDSLNEMIRLSTSSAGGGLQMLVFGVMRNVTADSAKKAALGGGAIVLDVMTTDDDRPSFLKLDSIRAIRPDMILISGGLDGGNTAFALEIADLLNVARPRSRFGENFRIPIVYAGNKDAAELVADTLSAGFDVTVVDNLRPSFDLENLEPTRAAIHELFMSHVMAHAPGYPRLCSWMNSGILPTPVAVGKIMDEIARTHSMNIVGVDIGGATTDVFSVIEGNLYRSVSANLGMSYSAGNVLLEAGIDNIVRWLPHSMPRDEVSDRICTKLIHPSSLPRSFADLQIEHALATEALRLAFEQHRQVATVPPRALPAWRSLVGKGQVVLLGAETRTVLNMADVGMLVGSGGVLSHAPKRSQAALIMLNAFLPEGVTRLAVDSIFMMPHLGALSDVRPDIALSVMEKDCLVPLGPVIALSGDITAGVPAVSVSATDSHGARREAIVCGGDICVIPMSMPGEVSVEATVLGAGSIGGHEKASFQCAAGEVGVIIDARGRPLNLPLDRTALASANAKWSSQMGAYGGEGGETDVSFAIGGEENPSRAPYRRYPGVPWR